LPTADNLKRWGKCTSDVCKVCKGLEKQTLNHVLSSCSIALEQSRYTWRHDSVLRTICDFIGAHLRDGLILFSDLTGRSAGNGGTFPPDIIATSQRPEIVIINREERKINIFELTCPWDQNTDKMHTFKTDKYAALLNNLLHVGFKADLFCFEVSVRGQITKANKARLKSFLLKATGMKRACSLSLINNVSKATLLSSFSLFCARNEMVWNVSQNMSVHMKS
jgi:hypothetical protein